MKVTAIVFILMPALLLAGADLELKDLSGVFQQDGTRVRLSFQISNHGPNQAAQPGCNVYVFSNERLALSQSFSLLPLSPGESRHEDFDVSLPSEVVTAVKVEIFDSREPDVQPSTNFAQINVKPPDYKKVDLQIVEATVETPKTNVERAGGIVLKLKNNGPDRSTATKLIIELVVYANAVAKIEKRIERLSADEQIEMKLPFPNPQTLSSPQGILRLTWVTTDPDLMDPNQENNRYELPVSLGIKLPDLVPRQIRIDRAGRLTFGVRNSGNARSAASVTAIYINGALIERYETRELQPNAVQGFVLKTKLETDAKVMVVTDFNADVEESSEENNRLNYPG